MRIALFVTSFLPKQAGLEFAVHYLADALQGLGHEVTVFAPEPDEPAEGFAHAYALRRYPPWLLKSPHHRAFLRWMRREIFGWHRLRRPFDVVNVHSASNAAKAAREFCRAFGLPYVVTCQGADIQTASEIGYGARLDQAKDAVIRRNLTDAAGVVAISESVYRDIAELVPAERIARVPNGVDAERFVPRWSASRAPEPPWDGGGPVILSVGRNVPKKRFDVGLEAFAQVATRHADVRYVHIGRDSEPLEQHARALGVAERFLALGEVRHDQLPEAYRAATIYHSPSAIEGFSLTNLEAMASGLPSVVTDGPGNGDAIRDGETGWVVPVDDVAAMAERLGRLLDDAAAREAFGQAARRAVETEYAWPIVAQRYVEVFESAARRIRRTRTPRAVLGAWWRRAMPMPDGR